MAHRDGEIPRLAQREAARASWLSERPHVVQGRLAPSGAFGDQPRCSQGRAANGVLHCSRQHAPPPARPSRAGGARRAWTRTSCRTSACESAFPTPSDLHSKNVRKAWMQRWSGMLAPPTDCEPGVAGDPGFARGARRCALAYCPRAQPPSSAARSSVQPHAACPFQLVEVSEGAFQVQDLGPKGMGVVAARDIEKGELLLKEQPLLVVPVVRDTRQLDAWEQRILADLADCPQQQQDSFWELADCHSEVGQKTATGIVRTNGLPIERADGADVVGLYSTMSRFNHSCIHNVNNSYQEDAGGEVLHALRNIRKGEELCITYIDLFLTRQDRQSTLQRVFNFRCTCPACSLTGEALLISNRSRDRLQQLREALPSAAQQGLGEAVIAKIVAGTDKSVQKGHLRQRDVVYLTLRCDGGDAQIAGWVSELIEGDLIVGTKLSLLSGVAQKTAAKIDGVDVGFVRVPSAACSLARPSGWTGSRIADVPGLQACQAAWKKVAKTTLESSEAEMPKAKSSEKSARLANELGGLSRFLGGGASDDEDEEETDDEDPDDLRYLAPGQSTTRNAKDSKKKKDAKNEIDVKGLLQASLASGAGEAKDLLTVVLLSQLVNQGQRKKGKRRSASSSDPLGGSSSDSSDGGGEGQEARGMKAVNGLHKLHAQILRKPKKIYEAFEAEAVKELGVTPGQAWTRRDFVKKQSWGRYKGLYRCAMMDVAVYEHLRAGRHEVATAQVVQNLKAKMQAVLHQGDWDTAWLLTGLPDPLHRKEWAGTKQEMSVVSGYVEAMTKLKKKVREAQGGADAEDEDAPAANRK
eukprot:s4313_g6.t1